MFRLENIVQRTLNSRLGRTLLAGTIALTMYGCSTQTTPTPEQEEQIKEETIENVVDNSTEETSATVKETAIKYAQKEIPSLANYFSGFGSLDEPIEIYINEAKYILTKAKYASPILEEKIREDTQDNKIDSAEVTGIQNLDGDKFSNKEEIAKRTNIVDPYNKLPPSIESLAVLNDELYAIVARNDDLVYEFNLQNFTSLFKELKEAPYADKLMKRITSADAKENVSEAWNYKVRREDEVLFSIIQENQKGFNGNSAEAWQFRFDNGSYHLNSWLDYKKTGDVDTIHILPLDNAGMKEWFPNKEDREFVYMEGLWVPYSMLGLDLSDMENEAKRTNRQRDERQWTTLRNNMDIILGIKKINELNQYENLRDRIVEISKDRTLLSYTTNTPLFLKDSSDYDVAVDLFIRRQTNPAYPTGGLEGFKSTLWGFGTIFKEIELRWDKSEFVELAYGLSGIDSTVGGDLPEQFDTATFSIYAKALGYAGFGQTARYPEYTGVKGDHQSILFPIPGKVLQKLPSDLLIYNGTIGPYSNVNGLIEDKVPYVRGPVTGKIVWELKN